MPTASFSIAASADDGFVGAVGSTWPLTSGDVSVTNDSQTTMSLRSRLIAGPSYHYYLALMRWDTSSLAGLIGGGSIDSATLEIVYTFVNVPDEFSLSADWYDFGGTVDSTDWVLGGADDAATFILPSLGTKQIPLQDGSIFVNTSGYTGLRLYFSGGEPVSDNQITVASFDHTTEVEPKLLVNYSLPPIQNAPEKLRVVTSQNRW